MMKQKRKWHFKWILFFLSFALAFPVGDFSAMAAGKITHTQPEGTYVPGFRIQLDVEIEGDADLLATRCYFKTKQDRNFAFTKLVSQGNGTYKTVLPAPWLNSEAVEYLFVAVDKDKKVTRTPLFVLEEGETQEAAAWQDASQVKELRIDTMQETVEDCEVVRRQLKNNHRNRLPRYQIAEDADPLMVQTELGKELVPLNGFYDAAVVTEVADSEKYGFMVENLYNTQTVAATGSSAGAATASASTAAVTAGAATGWSTAAIVGVGLGVAAVAGGAAVAINNSDDDDDNHGGGNNEPQDLTEKTIAGDWNVTGSRPDGYTMRGDFTLKDNGVFTYNTISATPTGEESTQAGDGTWTLNGTYLSLVVNATNGAGFEGTAVGDSNAFSLYSADNEFTLYLTR